MKNTFRTSFILVMSLVMTAVLASSALAAGTLAGADIDSTAQITYSIGGVPQGPEDSTTATIVVDNKVDLSMSGTGTAGVSGTDQAILFTLTNDGNETQSYQVTFYAEATSDDTDMTFASANSGLYLDNDASGDLSVGDTKLNIAAPVSGTYYPINVDVDPDNSVDILLVGDTPGGVTSGQTAEYSLVAQTLDAGTTTVTLDDGGTADNPTAIDVVLADGEAQTTDAVDGVPADTDLVEDGKIVASATYTFQGSGVTVTKTYAVLWDPINGATNPKAIPGAYVKYTLVVANAAGSPDAILNQVTDSLDGALAFDIDLIDGTDTNFPLVGDPESAAGFGFKVVHATGRATTPATQYFTSATADGVVHAAGLVTATFATILAGDAGYTDGELLAGESVTLYFNAIIQ